MTAEEYYSNIKRNYFEYMYYYQLIEEHIFFIIKKYSNNQNLKTIKSFKKLSNLFINAIKDNKVFSKTRISEIEYLLESIKRDYFIHVFSNECLHTTQLSELIVKNEILKQARKNIEKLIIAVSKEKNEKVLSKHLRHFERSHYSMSYTSDKLVSNLYDDSKQLKNIIHDNYFHLVSVYNVINKNLFSIIKEINNKYNLWSKDELDSMQDRTIGFLYEILASQNGAKGVITYDVINNLGSIKDSIVDIYKDRNYWIHYFEIDFYNEHQTFVHICNNNEVLLTFANAIRSSIIFSENFNNALVSLKI